MTDATEARQGGVHALAGLAGALIYILVVNVGGSPVAWSTAAYYWLGWPLMCVVIWVITNKNPRRSWRWPVSMMLGQVFASILYGNGAMIPIAVIFVTVLSIPQFLIANWVSKKQLSESQTENL
ncbi:hypothetical protein [Pseudohongiella spirulinae]|uniref:Uncharacterized protein n=1 Tax=Pseudohongiella spirulinae TaxID=1249552 RepID=A0A0S2KAE5_9GAMM|nr:hypothetical protein [Pseudohongiella spirulinae]ALO45043.1 hypothetical protein PS2015_353 [Pseudohongiella spirulinae]